ncbi:MAG: hypothetical protein ACQETB_09095 [Halobacteriota archaeon]
MQATDAEFDCLRGVLAEADEPLTAREIMSELEAKGIDQFDSSHSVATVLGRHAQRGGVTVISDRPYRYQLP